MRKSRAFGSALPGPYFNAIASKTVGRRVLDVCIAFSCFGRRPASGDAPREIEKKNTTRSGDRRKGGNVEGNEHFALLLLIPT